MSKYGVFSGPYFPVLGLNTEIYSVNLRIQSEYRKIRTRKNSVFGHFSRSGCEIDQPYNVKHPKYQLKDECTKNLRLLLHVEKLSEKNVEATIPQISKKMLVLKNHFSSEKRKVVALFKESGSGVSDVYNTKWQFYRHLLFLKDNFISRPTKTNLKRSFRSINTEEVRSPAVKRDTRAEAINRVVDSMVDMAQTILQEKNVAPVTTEKKKQRNQSPVAPLKFQISRLLRARSSLTFRQLYSVDSL